MPNEPYYTSTSCDARPDQTREATAGAIRTRRRMSGPPTSGGGMKSFAPVLHLQHATTQAYRTIECDDTRMIDTAAVSPLSVRSKRFNMYT
jgi:hypothetical protein